MLFMALSPRICVATVCLNAQDTIAATLESVAQQNFDSYEHIIIDGGSTDQTLAIVDKFARPSLRVINQAGRGASAAMHEALSSSNAEIIGFLNADDFFSHAEVLEKISIGYEQSKESCVYGDLYYVSQLDVGKRLRGWQSGPFRRAALRYGWHPPHPTFYANRERLIEVGGFQSELDFAFDTDLMIRFLSLPDINPVYIPEILVHMRMGGISNSRFSNILKQNFIHYRSIQSTFGSTSFAFIPYKFSNRLLQFVFH